MLKRKKKRKPTKQNKTNKSTANGTYYARENLRYGVFPNPWSVQFCFT
jgi:hypothetical protein